MSGFVRRSLGRRPAPPVRRRVPPRPALRGSGARPRGGVPARLPRWPPSI